MKYHAFPSTLVSDEAKTLATEGGIGNLSDQGVRKIHSFGGRGETVIGKCVFCWGRGRKYFLVPGSCMGTKQKSAITGGVARDYLLSKGVHRYKEEFDCHAGDGSHTDNAPLPTPRYLRLRLD